MGCTVQSGKEPLSLQATSVNFRRYAPPLPLSLTLLDRNLIKTEEGRIDSYRSQDQYSSLKMQQNLCFDGRILLKLHSSP